MAVGLTGDSLTFIAISNIVLIAMKLGEKIRQLRILAGLARGLDRELTQSEVASLIASEQGGKVSQSYLSQIEKGARTHLSGTTRGLLARFFRVHPGYLVDDIDGFEEGAFRIRAEMNERLDGWLVEGAEEHFRRDAVLRAALVAIAKHPDSRACLILLAGFVENRELLEALFATNSATRSLPARARARSAP
jgi:transcriptional regulator with XRE-family HTH domain